MDGLDISHGGELIMTDGFVFYVTGTLTVGDGGIVDIKQETQMGITLRETAVIEVKGGTLKTPFIRPTVASANAVHRGSYFQDGGTVILGGDDLGVFHSLSLPFKDNSFEIQNAGVLNVFATSGWGIHIGANPENVKVQGGKVNVFVPETPNTFDPDAANPDYPVFVVNSTSPFHHLETHYIKADDEASSYKNYGRVKLDEASFYWNGSSIVASEPQDLQINGSIKLNTYFDGNDKDLYVKQNLILNKEEAITYTGNLRNTSADESKWFNSSINRVNFIGDSDSQLEIAYTLSEEDIDSGDSNISFGNFRIDKDNDTNKVTLIADDTFSKAIVGGATTQNESNLIDFEGDFELLKGGLDHRNYSIRMFREGANLINYGTIGFYDESFNADGSEGTSAEEALLKFREGDIVIQTNNNSIFGNVRLYGEENKLEFTSDVYIKRAQYLSGTILLKNYTLTIDKLQYNIGHSISCLDNSGNPIDGCIEAKVPRFGKNYLQRGSEIWQQKNYNNFFVTDGKASSGGLRLKIDENTFFQNYYLYKEYFDYDGSNTHPTLENGEWNTNVLEQLKKDGELLSVLFPLAIEANDNYYYTPARVSIDEFNNTNDGYISVRPVLSKLPTTNQAGADDLLNIYWNINRSDFDEDIATLPKVRWYFGLENNFGDGNNPFTDGNDLTAVELQNLVPGKVLDGDSFIRDNVPTVVSEYQREGFSAPVFDGDNTITSGDIKQDVLLQWLWKNYNPLSYHDNTLLFAFDKNYDGSSTFVLENSNYTVGSSDAFDGVPGIYVYQNEFDGDGNLVNNEWDNINNWLVLDETTGFVSAAIEIPGIDDVAIFGTTQEYQFSNGDVATVPNSKFSFVSIFEGDVADLTDNIELAELRFEHTVQGRGRIEIKGSDLNIGKVSGSGEFDLDFGVIKAEAFYQPKLNGDFGIWATNTKSTLKLQLPKEVKVGEEGDPTLIYNRPDVGYNGEGRLTEIEIYDLPQLPIVEINTGAGYFTEDLKAYTLDIRFDATVYLRGDLENGNLEIENEILLFNSGGLVFAKEGDYPRTVITKDIRTVQYSGKDPSGQNHIYVEQGATTSPLQHKLYVSGNINIGDIANFDLFGAGNEIWDPESGATGNARFDVTNPYSIVDSNIDTTAVDVSSVSLILNGDTDASLTHSDVSHRVQFELYDLTINKKAAAKFTFEKGFSLMKNAEGNTEDKPLQLISGILDFNLDLITDAATSVIDMPIDLELNSGGEEFFISSDAQVIIRENTTLKVSSTEELTGGILLDGTLDIKNGGIVKIYNGDVNSNNYLSYGSSGNATIKLEEGAELYVGSQLRRQQSSDRGTITIYQSGGIIEVGGQNIPSALDSRAILEIVDEGSLTLDYTYVVGENNYFKVKASPSFNVNDVSMLLTPNTPSLSNFFEGKSLASPSRILVEGITGKDFIINASLPLGDIEIVSGEVGLSTNDLTIVGDIYINNGATFEQKDRNVSLFSDIYNSGTYLGTDYTTTFIGGTDQYLLNYNKVASGDQGLYSFGNILVNIENTILNVEYGKDVNGNDGISILGNLELEEAADMNLIQNAYLSYGLFLNEGSEISGSNALVFNGNESQVLYSNNGVIENCTIDNSFGVQMKDPENEMAFLNLYINGNLSFLDGLLSVAENTIYLGTNSFISGSNGTDDIDVSFNSTNMITLTDRNRDGGIIKLVNAGETDNSFIIPLGVENKYTPIDIDLTGNSSASTFGIAIKLLNEKPVKAYRSLVKDVDGEWISNPEPFEDTDILNYAWYVDFVKTDGNLIDKANITGHKVKLNFHYDQNDIEDELEEPKYISSININDSFYHQTIDEVDEDNNIAFIEIDDTFEGYDESENFAALIVIGDEDDIVVDVPIYRSRNRILTINVPNDGSDEQNWSTASSWSLSTNGGANFESAPDGIYPDGGAIVLIRRGTKLVLDLEVDLSDLTIQGENANYSDAQLIVKKDDSKTDVTRSIVGKVSGDGVLVMRTPEMLDDNWVNFLQKEKGSIIMDIEGELLDENRIASEITNISSSELISIKAIDNTVSGIYGFTTSAPIGSEEVPPGSGTFVDIQSYPVYQLKSNVEVGDGGITIKEYSTLVIGDIGQNVSVVTSKVTIEKDGYLALAGGTNLLVKGEFIAKEGAKIIAFDNSNSPRIIEFKKDVDIETGVDLSPDTFTFKFTGENIQQTINAEIPSSSVLRELIVNNNFVESEVNGAAVVLEKNLFVKDLDLIDGIVDSKNGFLHHIGTISYAPDAVLSDMNSYIIGKANFSVLDDHKTNTFFPIGTLREFHPIGVGQLEEKDTQSKFTKDISDGFVTWEVQFIGSKASLETPTKVKDQINGYWEINPINVGGNGARASENFTTTLNFIYTGKLDGISDVADLRILHQDIDNAADSDLEWSYLGDEADEPHQVSTNRVIQSQPVTFSYNVNAGARMGANSNARITNIAGSPSNSDNIVTVGSISEDEELPVELSQFTASINKGRVILDWKTLSEVNNDGFYIERSIDGRNYEEVAFVKGNGNSFVEIAYQFVDTNPYMGISYYRLVQEDFDGSIEIHGPIKVQLNLSEDESVENKIVNIYPNPSYNKDTKVDLYNWEGIVGVYLINNNGLVLQSTTIDSNKTNSTLLKTSSLPSGIYFIKAVFNKEVKVKKLIVK
ncbi:T9SS type A sorting domain-containing protein [Flammeovirga kamogawensis]|uniref:T9SS type A sorting domain-containing protein n=1 Tax=Flammeovirga kamogawensis TaxID=373891 RepID=A0ABX8H0C6_9BACT|nr:T9SS type A sorting domain-containing protein [Flammeovirga kamogawensis]MBB6459573.1 hypothetical protein [Flammeovirga kamogawensis]QWG09123.1 T9SS type A sorting domain-containing protein [Flammeovirga kamogawensis]TRX67411.1 T9SS type A sorting domain-containing protein [Flammeovirga kamogawensis]